MKSHWLPAALPALCCLLPALLLPLHAQEKDKPAAARPSSTVPSPPPAAVPPAAPAPGATDVVAARSTLDSLGDAIRTSEADLASLQKRAAQAAPAEKEDLDKKIADTKDRLRDLNLRFEVTARGTGGETRDDEEADLKKLTLLEELNSILRPYLNDLREATRLPREVENLSRELSRQRRALQAETAASTRIGTLLTGSGGDGSAPPPAPLKKKLQDMADTSRQRQEGIRGQIASLELQIAEMRKNAPSVFTLISSGLADFWRSRGISLLLALAACSLTLYPGLAFFRLVRRHSPLHRRYATGVPLRLLDFTLIALLALAGFAAPLTVLYVRNDWLLLTLVMILGLGLIMASRTFFMPVLEQFRLYLNIGNVRLGERVIIGGLPWRVDKLQFYCRLINPELSGARMRLPAAAMRPLFSRPSLPDEPWFPSRVNDWVLLDDGTVGKVVVQTPEQVALLKIGGTRKTYATPLFLAKNPENLSLKDFSVRGTFGISHAHQNIALTTIPQELERGLTAAVHEKYGRGEIISVLVEFSEAAATSLNYLIVIHARGSLAPRLSALQRLIQRICLTTCLQNGWSVPGAQAPSPVRQDPPNAAPPTPPPPAAGQAPGSVPAAGTGASLPGQTSLPLPASPPGTTSAVSSPFASPALSATAAAASSSLQRCPPAESITAIPGTSLAPDAAARAAVQNTGTPASSVNTLPVPPPSGGELPPVCPPAPDVAAGPPGSMPAPAETSAPAPASPQNPPARPPSRLP